MLFTVAIGLLIAALDKPADGDHAYVAPAVAVALNGTGAPEQTVVSLLAVNVRLSVKPTFTVFVTTPQYASFIVMVLAPLVKLLNVLDVWKFVPSIL